VLCRLSTSAGTTRTPPSVVLKITTADVHPAVVPPGMPVTLRVRYHIVAPPGKDRWRATVSGHLSFNPPPLVSLPLFKTDVQTRDPIRAFSYPLPADAAEGTCAVEMAMVAEPAPGRRVMARTKKILFEVRRLPQ
jgi:hypothetical protein